jgi:WD40 repeat protein
MKILKVPGFDLKWIDVSSGNEKDTTLLDYCCLVPGGGGSIKSGVTNQIQIIGSETKEGLSYNYCANYATDNESKGIVGFASGVGIGHLSSMHALVVLIDARCVLLKVKKSDDKSERIQFTNILDFVGDFYQKKGDSDDGEASVSCCLVHNAKTLVCTDTTCVQKNKDLIIVGGEDGKVRLFQLKEQESDKSKAICQSDDGQYSLFLEAELKGHAGPIKSMDLYTPESWVCTSGKDGFCYVWDLTNSKLILTLEALSADLNLPSTTSKGAVMECRGCVFAQGIDVPASDEKDDKKKSSCYLYTLQCGRRGPATLIKWKITYNKKEASSTSQEKKENSSSTNTSSDTMQAQATMHKFVQVSKYPGTRLSVSPCGLFIAMGDSDGKVYTLSTDSLAVLQTSKYHDFPVTGLSFAPEMVAVKNGLPAVLTTCSVDQEFNVIPIGGRSAIVDFVLKLIMVLIFSFLCLMALSLIYINGGKSMVEKVVGQEISNFLEKQSNSLIEKAVGAAELIRGFVAK